MTKKNEHGILVAGEMAAKWSDEVLGSKAIDDVARSFGISMDSASHVLRREKVKRKLQ